MKVNNGNVNPILLNSAQNCPPQNADEPIDCAVRQNNFETTASDCIAQMGKAQVFMQNSSKTLKPQSDEEIIELINNIVKYDGMEIGRFCRGGEHISIGTPVPGFRGLVNDDVRAKCIDRQHWQEQEFLLNKNSRFVVTGFDDENNIIKVKYLE